jgi:hypothetical protein
MSPVVISARLIGVEQVHFQGGVEGLMHSKAEEDRVGGGE